jgi:hypothetical protein
MDGREKREKNDKNEGRGGGKKVRLPAIYQRRALHEAATAEIPSMSTRPLASESWSPSN